MRSAACRPRLSLRRLRLPYPSAHLLCHSEAQPKNPERQRACGARFFAPATSLRMTGRWVSILLMNYLLRR
jgi:hypothetical protein